MIANDYRFYKPVSDWLENLMLPLDSTGLNIFLNKKSISYGLNEMKRNDLWLNVKGNYVLCGKDTFEFILK